MTTVQIITEGAPLEYATDGAAAMDLRSRETVALHMGDRKLVRTGIRLGMPDGVAAYVLPRSGLALHYGITVLNSPGLIDSDYRGEIGVVLINHGQEPYIVNAGDRIAQLQFINYLTPTLRTVARLDDTDRGSGGFGSTGTE